ncbi:hypothetical protein [Vibrio casei]|uniref:hypothetical protein n=1 Tax=Vibrio casei TaxID=673372 RepID=UPI0013A65AFA|nr:hypothetical protein [Vibrio casei]
MMTVQHKKVTEQPQQWLNSVYYPATVNKLNIAFNGGKNYKLHKQYNNIINLLLSHPEATENHKTACKVFAFHCVLHAKNGNSFIIPRRKVMLDNKHEETQGRTPTAYQWLQVQDIAVQKGLGEVFVGGEDFNGSFLPSIFVMSPMLLDIIKTKNVDKAPSKPKQSPKESIIVWDSNDKKTRQQIKIAGSREIQNNLNVLNNFLLTNTFKTDKGQIIDPTMKRSFIKSFDNYGRFSHSYQSTPQHIRQHITINGEAVCEGDYSSNHARIAYELENVRKDEDFKPYYLSKEDCPLVGSSQGKRAIYKLAMMMLFNSGNPTQSLFNDMEQKYNTIEKKKNDIPEKLKVYTTVNRPTIKDCSIIVQGLKKVNSEIGEYFKGCQAGYLQNLDAKIAERIMLDLTAQGIPFLCFHDSFIVPQSKALQLQQAMHKAWADVLGSQDNCIVDFKYGHNPEQETEQQQAIEDLEQQHDFEYSEADQELESWGFVSADTFHEYGSCPTCNSALNQWSDCENVDCDNWLPF